MFYEILSNLLTILIIVQLITSSLMANDIEHHIAEYNIKGFPSSLLYEAIGSPENEDKIDTIDKNMLSKYLESRQIQAKAIKIALQYAANEIKEKGTTQPKTDNTTDSEMCDYSWIAWLPWSGCPQNEPAPINKIELIKEQNYKCYKTKY